MLPWFKGPENAVQGVKQNASYATPSLGTTLCDTAKIVNVNLEASKWSTARLQGPEWWRDGCCRRQF
jgi:hypothetical protein